MECTQDFIGVVIAPYALKDTLRVLMLCGIRRIHLTKEDGNLVLTLSEHSLGISNSAHSSAVHSAPGERGFDVYIGTNTEKKGA